MDRLKYINIENTKNLKGYLKTKIILKKGITQYEILLSKSITSKQIEKYF